MNGRVRLFSAGQLTPWAAFLNAWFRADERSPSPHATAAWAWNTAWIRHYGDTVSLFGASAEVDGQPQAFVLLPRSRNRSVGPIPIQTQHLGTAGDPHEDGVFVEYATPWSGAGIDAAAFAAAAADEACRRRVEGTLPDRLDLDGVSGELRAALRQPPAGIEVRPSPFHDTSHGDPDRVLAALGRSTRRNLKRRLNAYPGLRVEWSSDAPTSLQMLDELIPLHQARWTARGERGAFASRRFEGFVRELIRLSDGDDRVILSRVSDDAGTVGCILLLRHGNHVCDYTAGFASPQSRPSPGLVAHFANIREAARRGVGGYEFLVGDARVKTDLATGHRDLHWVQLPQATARIRMAAAARMIARALKRRAA